MLTDFFQTSVIPSDQYIGSYHFGLVLLSFLTAVAASYIALDMTGRIRDISNTAKSSTLWLLGGAIAMGSGIWSMHFIGMLSFTIPGLSLRYDLFWTALSLVVAILASGFALYLLQSTRIRIEHYIMGGMILGLAIAAMHYTGMEGMLITLNVRYLPVLFFISILIAILASEAALWLALKSNHVISKLRNRFKVGSAIIMGIAICGMHYTGMAASIFTPLCAPVTSPDANVLDPTLLAIGIAGVTFIILGIAFFASTYKEAINEQQFEKARQLGMAEISASVLHSVGNVLNSVNVSAQFISEKMAKSKLSDLDKLATLFESHKKDISHFIEQDPKGEKAIEYIRALSDYWNNEQKDVSSELNRLINNMRLIKDIISTQQVLSKTIEFEEIISVNDILDEAILITGLNIPGNMTIVKKYGRINPMKTDKVKLIQIFVNLLRNAKDAVMASNHQEKIITITTSCHANKCKIDITDNGVGISENDLKRIFNYGFTTKESGHGFGLHTSALAVNSLGGKIESYSQGKDQGATFVLEFSCGK
ncbi:MAG TPA: MHYT domain-containing protein [Gammaproteobacteria bacterium]|nr:MHYT domain-containing protein [Gammaproteobacteria bacterium]